MIPHRTFAPLVALVLLLLAAAPAGAIQYGEPDNGAHPYVGGLVFEVDGSRIVGCSGTLIGPTTFLIAAHCAPDDDYRLVGVTFADAFTPGESKVVAATRFVANPGYDGTASTDVAVVLLRRDRGVGLATLPEIGLLDTLAPSADAGDQDRYLTAAPAAAAPTSSTPRSGCVPRTRSPA